MANGSAPTDNHLDVLLPGLKLVEGWEEVEQSQVEVTRLSAAFSNYVYRCELKGAKGGAPNSVVLGRVYGDSGGMFERESEVEQFKHIHEAGVGPKLLASFPNGRIEEFLSDYRPARADEIRDDRVSLHVAAAMGEFHCKMLDYYKYNADVAIRPGEATVWDRIEQWYDIACAVNKALVNKLGLVDVLEKVDIMRNNFDRSATKCLCFCHNDLQHGNIMTSSDRASLPSVRFIDFEFSGFNPIAFEIASHWCEWTCDYDSPQPHIVKRDRFPDKDQRYAFLGCYLNGVATTAADMGISASDAEGDGAGEPQREDGSEVDEAGEKVKECLTGLLDLVQSPGGIDALHAQAMRFVPIADLLCGLWGIIRDSRETGIDFNFREFAAQKIRAFRKADSY